ncbi:hypothetical protein NC651_024349 [Populus alba x Populus x berolinensis]|nr:hypothetical protein NC651_024349 [Populus alba x Populus x berolinensis]
METPPSFWILDGGWQAETATSMLTLKLHKQAVTLTTASRLIMRRATVTAITSLRNQNIKPAVREPREIHSFKVAT